MAPPVKNRNFQHFGLFDSLHKQYGCFSDSKIYGIMENIATCHLYP